MSVETTALEGDEALEGTESTLKAVAGATLTLIALVAVISAANGDSLAPRTLSALGRQVAASPSREGWWPLTVTCRA